MEISVSSKIKLYLNDKGIKQKYLAEQVGINENHLSMILNNKATLDMDLYLKIIRVLKVDANTFINSNLTYIEN